MVMEPMSEGSVGVREGVERGKLRGGVRGKGVGVGDEGGMGKRKRGEEGWGENEVEEGKEEGERKKRRVRGPKGPNPLSVKKPKRKGEGEGGREKVGKLSEDTTASRGDERPGEVKERRDMDGADGGELRDSAGTKKKRKRKHKSAITGTEDGAATDGAVGLDEG